MQKNKIISLVVIAIIIIGVSFYGGMKYGQNSKTNLGAGNFSQRMGQFGNMASSTNRGGNRGVFGGAISGQILSIDKSTLTVKDQTGGSRLVFLSASTTVNKMIEGSVKDLVVGSNVSINGATNADNSINAQMIQIRPISPAQPK